jgi:hypothetical protein
MLGLCMGCLNDLMELWKGGQYFDILMICILDVIEVPRLFAMFFHECFLITCHILLCLFYGSYTHSYIEYTQRLIRAIDALPTTAPKAV